MPRGGPRVGAGRPKGVGATSDVANPARTEIAARKAKMSPLEYMLKVMNDVSADDARRDKMAVAAASYVHAKPGDSPKGKKEEAQEASRTAGAGTGWGDDLGAPSSAIN